jgi:predicted enzyme related to lactoylglutathione lyase
MEGMDYTLLRMDAADGATHVTGGILRRRNPEHKGIMAYFGVESVEARAERVREAGGKILMQKTAVPGYGYFVICRDTEKNTFAMWEEDKGAGNG